MGILWYIIQHLRGIFMLCNYDDLMRVHSKEDMNIYRKIEEYVEGGVVVPFDKDILDYLNSHVDAGNEDLKTNYLDALNSSYSIGKCHQFSRYLALAMAGRNFKLCEGRLSAFDKGDFPHAWIEDETWVYDVTFMGVWPKDVYYKLFFPCVDKVVDLENDAALKEYKNNTVDAKVQNKKPYLKYRNWYSYYYSLRVPFVPEDVVNEVKTFYFPGDRKGAFLYEFISNIQDYWYKTCKENRELPEEVLESVLLEFIIGEHYLKSPLDVYLEYLNFISTNYALYEAKKKDKDDLTLWKTSVDQKYSGSLCLFIGELPKILAYVDEEKKKAC